MELQGDDEADGTPIEDLAERVRGTHEDNEDVWAALAEEADGDGEFTRGGVPESDFDNQERAGGRGDGAAGPGAKEGDLASNNGSPGISTTDTADEIEGEGELPSPDAHSSAEDPLEELIDPDDERLDPRDARRVGDSAEEYVVPKDGYCEACPYFSAPPDVGCTNDGTDIVEFEDMNHVRVRNCPKVDEERVTSNGG